MPIPFTATALPTEYSPATLQFLKAWIPTRQHRFLSSLVTPKGSPEEYKHFQSILLSLHQSILNLPKIYSTQKDPDAKAILHFFGPGDWWIIESQTDNSNGYIEAYGIADLGFGKELGYLSIAEIVATHQIEIDLYFTPVPWKSIMKKD